MLAKGHLISNQAFLPLFCYLLLGGLHVHRGCAFQHIFTTSPITGSTNTRAEWSVLKVQAEETPATAAAESHVTDLSFTLPPFMKQESSTTTSHDNELTTTSMNAYDYPSPLHTVHVRSILSDDEAATCLRIAQDYATATGCWDQPDQERHSTYSTCDFPVEDNEDLASYLADIEFDNRIKHWLQKWYGIEPDFMSYLDFFCAHYQAQANQENNNNNSRGHDDQNRAITTMDRLEAHRDGSLLSFTILLNSPTDFEGGGTFLMDCAM